jgi:hypothetical protein
MGGVTVKEYDPRNTMLPKLEKCQSAGRLTSRSIESQKFIGAYAAFLCVFPKINEPESKN